jgi:hypothetical protein
MSYLGSIFVATLDLVLVVSFLLARLARVSLMMLFGMRSLV